MAHSDYKVLTDVDLSKNKLFNITEIRNDDPENNLTIYTAGNTSVDSKNVSLTAAEPGNTSKVTAAPSALTLSTSGEFNVFSETGATVDDDVSIDLTAPIIKETASTSVNVYSGKINLQNTETSPAEKIVLDNSIHKITAAAGNASISITGNTTNTVGVGGTEFKVSSSKSTFDNNSTFSKNVNIVGDLTTRDMTGEAAKLNSLDVKATTTVGGNLTTSGNVQLTSIDGVDATLERLLTVNGTTDVTGNATVGELKVADGSTLTANNGLTSDKAVSIQGTTTVNGAATVGILEVVNGKTLTAENGLTSKELISVEGTTTVGGTATTGILAVTGKLAANNGFTSGGLVSVTRTTSVGENASTGNLAVDKDSTLTANDGLTSNGLVSVTGTTSVDKNASTGTLVIPNDQTLTAISGMTSTGAVTVSGTTSIATITGDGSLTIPPGKTLIATNGGSSGSVDVTSTTVDTITGSGSLAVPAGKALTVTNGGTSSSIDVANTTIVTVTGSGSLIVPSGKSLIINNGGTSGTPTTGIFTPTDVTINKISGDGSLVVPNGKTLIASNGGAINGSMTIGRTGSADTNLTLNGNATIGTSGSNPTTLTSYAAIAAESTLGVKGTSTFTSKATFNSDAEVQGDFILDSVTIKWDSTLGALTFSKG